MALSAFGHELLLLSSKAVSLRIAVLYGEIFPQLPSRNIGNNDPRPPFLLVINCCIIIQLIMIPGDEIGLSIYSK